jgi:hypothetical protein
VGRRGIIPSLGAGTSLIVAGVLLLAVVSSIIAFRGFPGLGPGAARPPVRLAAPAADRTGRTAPAPIVVGATLGSAALTAPVRRPAAHGSARAHADAPAVRIGTAPAGDGGSGSSPTPPVSDPVAETPPAASPSTSRPGDGAQSTSSVQPRPVRRTVDRVRDVVPSVQPPPVPPAVQPVADEAAGVVDTANDVVDQTAGVADDVVGGLLP